MNYYVAYYVDFELDYIIVKKKGGNRYVNIRDTIVL